jgi:hypothetical protein
MDPRSTVTPLELQKLTELNARILTDMRRVEGTLAQAASARAALAGKPQAAEMEAAITRVAGAPGAGRGGRGGRGGGAPAGAAPTLATVSGMLSTALSAAGSADRTPPATAYEVVSAAEKELTRLMTEWETLKTKLPK